MYAHQVIEDLDIVSKFLSKTESKGLVFGDLTSSYASFLKKMIENSQKFHLFVNKESSVCKTGVQVFCEDNGNVRLPYKVTWLDLFRELDPPGYKPKKTERKDGDIPVTKRGVLAIELTEKLIFTHVFNCFEKESILEIPTKNGWQMSPFFELFCIDSKISDHFRIFEGKMFEGFQMPKLVRKEIEINQSNMCAQSLIPGLPDDYKFELVQQDMDEISQLNCFLKLLDCKNIGTIDNEPPAKLNKSRVKKGKQPIFTYKTLVIKPTGERQQSLAAQGLWENRIHLCRGHFKEFSIEKPLFGKYSGRYWWQPAVRGRNREGVVMKDYDVRSS